MTLYSLIVTLAILSTPNGNPVEKTQMSLILKKDLTDIECAYEGSKSKAYQSQYFSYSKNAEGNYDKKEVVVYFRCGAQDEEN